MDNIEVINEYFQQLKRNLEYKKTSKAMGFQYSLPGENKEDEVLRFLIDSNLNASIAKNKTNKVCSFDYIDKSDLLIIGYSLEGKQVINYKGKNLIEKGEVFYFRPIEDFTVELFDSSFLYYFVDLKSLGEASYSRNYKELCLNNICKKGDIHIEKSPYIMKSYVEEIKEIGKMEVDSFLDYANIKGKLFSYLTWLVRLKLNCNSISDENQCALCHVSRAKKIIIDNLDKQITVKEIAERLDISTYKLQKSFKEVEDTTVYNFIRNSKIDNSMILLKNKNLSIIDISQRTGYENPSKFSTAFKDITGYTPTEYRETIED